MRFLIYLFLLYANVLMSQSHASARVTKFSLDAPQLKTSRQIWLYLPKGYESSREKYPVLYMHDAQNLFDTKTSFAGEWRVDETLDSLKANVIVVGIEHGNDKRIDELTPFKNEKYGGGNADAYLDFIVQTLRPYIDRQYRTRKNPENTLMMGSSLGGLASFYAVLKYPKVFGKAGIFSPSFWFSRDIEVMANASGDIKAKLFFLCGDDEDPAMVPDMRRMIDLMRNKKKAKHIFEKVVAGGKHNEKLWRDHFANAYLWLIN